MNFDVKTFTQTLSEFRDKLKVSISNKRVRQITNSSNAVNKDSYDRENIKISERNKAFKFCELINYYHNIAVGAVFVRT